MSNNNKNGRPNHRIQEIIPSSNVKPTITAMVDLTQFQKPSMEMHIAGSSGGDKECLCNPVCNCFPVESCACDKVCTCDKVCNCVGYVCSCVGYTGGCVVTGICTCIPVRICTCIPIYI
ncbi:hypothetical protein FJZ33_04600 [Candidatus Poribacteria bacterium]|nr:hypothetical protein [Candidatus Poribacteria bacterium]